MVSLTPERYLEIERAAESKSEYFDGRMFAMSGGTYAHARLITSFAAEVYQALRNRPCSVTSSELRVRTTAQGLHTYPDALLIEVFARCHEGDWRLREFAGL